MSVNDIRRSIIEMAYRARGAHIGSSLSCVDILYTLYFDVLKLDPWEERDIFIMSKGHGAMALYATLAARGIIPQEMLNGYCLNDGTLPAHLDRTTAKGIEASAGSLGHGFNIGLGMAYGFKQAGSSRRVFVLIGDGECQEGSIWEGAMIASRLGLDNFTAILDYNNLQGYGTVNDICHFEPIWGKWEAFGWCALSVDGHDPSSLKEALSASATGRPKIVIANTVKGKGVSFMENCMGWHSYILSETDKEKALAEL